jgi:hypothetical protein
MGCAVDVVGVDPTGASSQASTNAMKAMKAIAIICFLLIIFPKPTIAKNQYR